MNDFYTYAYLREDRTPYYIGKGKHKHKTNQKYYRAYCGQHWIPIPPKERIIILKDDICENDIITGCKHVPCIWYNDENEKKHRHYVDIFIPSKNTCIEVKSTWTAEKKKDNIFLKQNAAKQLGYKYEIWVYDNKGVMVQKHE